MRLTGVSFYPVSLAGGGGPGWLGEHPSVLGLPGNVGVPTSYLG